MYISNDGEVLTKAFTLVGGSVNEHFRADDVSEWQKHLHQLGITEFLR